MSQFLQQMLLRTASCTATNVCPKIQNQPRSFAWTFRHTPAGGTDNPFPDKMYFGFDPRPRGCFGIIINLSPHCPFLPKRVSPSTTFQSFALALHRLKRRGCRSGPPTLFALVHTQLCHLTLAHIFPVNCTEVCQRHENPPSSYP